MSSIFQLCMLIAMSLSIQQLTYTMQLGQHQHPPHITLLLLRNHAEIRDKIRKAEEKLEQERKKQGEGNDKAQRIRIGILCSEIDKLRSAL
jgi:hypothetical protein